MSWVELFAVFIACHLAGDFLLQTHWQAQHKYLGLGREATARRALLTHVATYTLAYLPALAWVGLERGAGRAALAASLITLPHLIQDDGRLLALWVHRVKGVPAGFGNGALLVAVDQSFHVIALLGAALLIAS